MSARERDAIETLETARSAVGRERELLAAEKRAFGRFERRVRALETAQPRPVGPTTAVGDASPSGVTDVRRLYAETVMSVDHYAVEYDESWVDHLAGEFSEELAAALAQHAVLTPPLKRSLCEAAAQAVRTRERVIGQLADEREAIEDVRGDLRDVLESVESIGSQPLDRLEFNAIRLSRDRLLELQATCDELVAERQRQLRKRRTFSLAGVGTFERYLYADCPHTYPVLAAIAMVGDRIRALRRRLERSLVTVQ